MRGNAAAERYELVLDGDGAVAVRQISQSVGADGVGAGMVTVIAPAAEVVEGESIPAVQRDNAADLPVANDGVDDVVDVVAELFAAADGELVGEITCDDVLLIVVTRSPVCIRVIDVLPAGLAAGTLSLSAAPTGAEVAGRVAEALGVSVSELAVKTVIAALFEDGLKTVIALVGVGHVRSGQCAKGVEAVATGIGVIKRTSRSAIPFSGVRNGAAGTSGWGSKNATGLRIESARTDKTAKERSGGFGDNLLAGKSNRSCGVQTFSLRNVLEIEEMRTLLADIADLEGECVAELLLDGEVPLLNKSRAEILVKDADSASRVAAELRRGTGRSALPG